MGWSAASFRISTADGWLEVDGIVRPPFGIDQRAIDETGNRSWFVRGAAVSGGWPDAVGARARRIWLVRPPAARSIVQTRGKGLSQHGSGKIFSMPRIEPTP